MGLPSLYQEVIHMSRYSKYRDDFDSPRREVWTETMQRWYDFWIIRYPEYESLLEECRESISNLETMPSMRSLMTAGVALERDNIAGYNCSYLPIEHPRCFDELMYILMNGTGVGFSVERQYVNRLPEIAETFHNTDTTIVVSDSKIGWASSYRELISLLYAGKIPKWDMSKVRPAGARLKTFGGRASGPEPLEKLFRFTVNTFKKAVGRKLNSIECHDIVCMIAEIVVVGGVRRSALISLSNLSDDRMRSAKSGSWWVENVQRSLSNNSYVVDEKPDFGVFLNEWLSLHESKSGERGIISRYACRNIAKRNGRRDPDHEWGTNPCAEIILRPYQFCNLSEVVVRSDDTLDTLKKKVRIATIIGTFQSTLTDFKYLRKKWKQNCEEERLLGVSMTGIYDHEIMSGRKGHDLLYNWLSELLKVSIDVNDDLASQLGINQSTAITCVKPSGTVSQLVDSASGIHPRFAKHYIRRIRQDKKDPLTQFLIDNGVPYEQDASNPTNFIFAFPIKSPDTSLTVNDVDAIEQLKLWEAYAKHWCEHKPSMTTYYNDDNFLDVGSWVWNNFDEVSGISFMPYVDHNYPQAPYEAIDAKTYEMLVSKMPNEINWEQLRDYETNDHTTSSQEFACQGGACEL